VPGDMEGHATTAEGRDGPSCDDERAGAPVQVHLCACVRPYCVIPSRLESNPGLVVFF
jgi:hypothetical protein